MTDPSEFEGLTEAQAEVARKQAARRRYVYEQVVMLQRSQADLALELGCKRQVVHYWLQEALAAQEKGEL